MGRRLATNWASPHHFSYEQTMLDTLQQTAEASYDWLTKVVVPGSATGAVIAVVVLFLKDMHAQRAATAKERSAAATAAAQERESATKHFLAQLEAFDRAHLQRLDSIADRFVDAAERQEGATKELTAEIRAMARSPVPRTTGG